MVREVLEGLDTSGSFDCALRAPLRMTALWMGGGAADAGFPVNFLHGNETQTWSYRCFPGVADASLDNACPAGFRGWGDADVQLSSDQFFTDVYFKFAPTAGTSAGLHQYDAQLEDYSA